jgi:hypothetical protein
MKARTVLPAANPVEASRPEPNNKAGRYRNDFMAIMSIRYQVLRVNG